MPGITNGAMQRKASRLLQGNSLRLATDAMASVSAVAAYAAASSTRTGYEKNPQSWVETTWKRAGSAISAGAPKSAIASRKQMIKLPTMAGKTSGSVMRKVVRSVPAPRMCAASSISEEIRASAELVTTKTYGQVATATTRTRPGIE